METIHYEHAGIPIARTVLDSGLTVITGYRPGQSAHARIVIPVGSFDDGAQFQIHHLLEHAVIAGPEIADGVHPALRPLLLRGSEKDAGTGEVGTYFCLTGTRSDVHEMIAALGAMVFRASLVSTVVDRERDVVSIEMGGRTQNGAYSFRRWRRHVLYPHVRQAQLPSFEAVDHALRAVTHDDVVERYEREYHPAHSALIVIGDVQHDDVASYAHKSMPSGATHTPRAVSRGRIFLPRCVRAVLHDRRAPQGVQCYWSGLLPFDPRTHIATNVGIGVLNASPFGTLFRAFRLKRRMVYHVECGYDPHPLFDVAIDVSVSRGRYAMAERMIRKHVHALAHGRVYDDAFQTQRAHLLRLMRERGAASVTQWADWMRDLWLDDRTGDSDSIGLLESMTPDDVAHAFQQLVASGEHGVLSVDDGSPEQ